MSNPFLSPHSPPPILNTSQFITIMLVFPSYFILWGVFFHTVAAGILTRLTTKVPFLDGQAAQTVKIVFFLCFVLSGACHHAAIGPAIGLSPETMNTVFLVCAAVGLVGQICPSPWQE